VRMQLMLRSDSQLSDRISHSKAVEAAPPLFAVQNRIGALVMER